MNFDNLFGNNQPQPVQQPIVDEEKEALKRQLAEQQAKIDHLKQTADQVMKPLIQQQTTVQPPNPPQQNNNNLIDKTTAANEVYILEKQKQQIILVSITGFIVIGLLGIFNQNIGLAGMIFFSGYNLWILKKTKDRILYFQTQYRLK